MLKPNSQEQLLLLLKTHFGYDSFRPNQYEVIQDIICKKDVLAIMPTGGGKSLCFQLPALALEGTAIVVSPLIALMKDQVDVLSANGIAAAYYNSSQTEEVQQETITKLKKGVLKLFYVAPESIAQFETVFKDISISLFAIDEAHCISSWGHDFRPAYTQLGNLKVSFPTVPMIALTATADKATQDDIVEQLSIHKASRHLASFNRPNLFLDVRPGQDRLGQIISFLETHQNESGIIYCLSRKNTETLAEKLRNTGHKAKSYHAGMDAQERTQVQEDFINDRVPIICATIAFGMGIDKSNVRWVIHYNLPKNIEGYYQEIGRGGRDSLPAHTLLFYSYADVVQLRKFIDKSANANVQYAKLERMQQYAEALSCRRIALLNYFGEHVTTNCGNCDICKKPPSYFDATILAQKICSCVARLKEQESMSMLIDVLRGAQNAQVFEKGYQHIKTYGAIKDISWQDVQQYIIQLLNQGVLEINFRAHSRIVLTPLAKEVLYENRKIQLATLNQRTNFFDVKKPVKKVKNGLFEKLRELRHSLAKEQGVPAYVIFGDASLKDMEEKKPTTIKEFSEIIGVGKTKLDKYADLFLAVINANTKSTSTKVTTHQKTFDLYKEGFTPAEIAKQRKLTENTIYSHLMKMYSQGEDLDMNQFVTTEEIAQIEKAKESLEETVGLKGYFEYLEEKIPYWKLKIGLALIDY